MRRVVFVTVIVGLLVTAAGCGRPTAVRSPGGPPAAAQQAPSDRAQIYAALLLRFIAHNAASVGAGPPTAVYVLDAATSDAGPNSGMNGGPATYPIPAADQSAVLALIQGKSGIPVSFVASGAGHLPSAEQCARITDGPLLVTLGPVPTTVAPGAAPFEVAINATMGCMTFLGVSYPMERGPDGWVAGEPHSMSIA